MIENKKQEAENLADEIANELENYSALDIFLGEFGSYTDDELIELFRYMAQSCRMRGN